MGEVPSDEEDDSHKSENEDCRPHRRKFEVFSWIRLIPRLQSFDEPKGGDDDGPEISDTQGDFKT